MAEQPRDGLHGLERAIRVMRRTLRRINAEWETGTFDYAARFPSSRKLAEAQRWLREHGSRLERMMEGVSERGGSVAMTVSNEEAECGGDGQHSRRSYWIPGAVRHGPRPLKNSRS